MGRIRFIFGNNRGIIAVLALSLVVFTLISIVNHALFRTYCLDLGYYTQCLWDSAHGRINQSLIFKAEPLNFLASHFDLYLIIFSPLVYIFGNYTLLVVQIAALLFGCTGMYRLLLSYSDNKVIAISASLSFSMFFGVIHAVAYDYHSNVVAASMLPWFFLSIREEKYLKSAFYMLFMLISKENFGLLISFVLLGLMWDARKNRVQLLYLSGFLVFTIVYTFVILKLVMPSLGNNCFYNGFYRYAEWGTSAGEIIKNCLLHPIRFIKTMVNHQNKIEFIACVLLSGGLIAFGKPNYALMTIPLLVQKMLTFDPNLWGIAYQYGVEFAPVIIAACFITISKTNNCKTSNIISITASTIVVATTIYTVDNPKAWFRRDNVRIYQTSHYRQDSFSAKDAYDFIKMIPEDASVTASSCFCPHLCFRDSIFVYPHEKNVKADYAILTQEFENEDFSFFENGYDTVASSQNLFLLKKR